MKHFGSRKCLNFVPEMINNVVKRAKRDFLAVREMGQVTVSGTDWITAFMHSDGGSDKLAIGLKRLFDSL